MKSGRLLKLLGVIALAAVIAIAFVPGCAEEAPAPAPVPEVEKPTYSIVLSQYQASWQPGYLVAEDFKKRVEQASNGRILINHFPGQLLGDWHTVAVDVKRGAVDMCMSFPTTLDPAFTSTKVPYLVFDYDGYREIYGPGSPVEKIREEISFRNGFHQLGTQPQCFNIIISTEKFTPIPGHPSIAALKARTMPYIVDQKIGEALGFMTLSLPWGELHGALMLGTVDAALGPSWAEAVEFIDICKYAYNYLYGCSTHLWLMNIDLWRSLSAEDQNIIQTAMDEALLAMWYEVEEIERKAMEECRAAGMEVIELTPEEMRASIEAVRAKVWPYMEKDDPELFKRVSASAQPLPD